MQKFSAFVCLPWNKGQKKIGTEEGAAWIAEYVETELASDTQEFYVEEDADISDNLERMYNEILKHPPPYLFAGGDHSEAISTVLAVINHPKYQGKRVGLIWIDAHADINTYEMSKSKNYHGMPLSFVCGIDSKFEWVNKIKKLPLQHLLYYGIRDIDQYEQQIIEKENLKVVKVDDDYQEIFKWIEEKQIEVVFVSFDIDALDPLQLPSTGTTSPNGLKTERTCQFFRRMREEFSRLKIEWNIQIVELNPLIGKEEERKRTEKNLRSLLEALFK